MSETTKRTYIPRGCHQQGRLQTQAWLPRRVDPDFVDTYPTGPAPLPEAAHAASELDDDRDRGISQAARCFWLGYAAFIVAVLLLVAVLASGAWK